MSKSYWTLFFFSLLLTNNACNNTVSTHSNREELPAHLQALLQEAIDDSFESVPGVSMSVIAPELDLHWQGAAGYDSKELDQPLTIDQPFRIASITKTFVAAAMLRLHEQDSLDLNAPISALISPDHNRLLKNGGYDPTDITWRQILHHTSGIFDYAMSESTYAQMIIRDPKHRWTRTEQIELAMDIGTPKEPNTTYHYSDTGYVLAGEAIERSLDTSLAAGLRQQLGFEQLGLTSTWLESLEPAPPGHPSVVHRYLGKNDVTEWDASIDLYGGGGLVSTCDDLAIFLHAIFNNQVFQRQETLNLMLSNAQLQEGYTGDEQFKDYRLGLWHAEVFGHDAFLHGGLWGTGLIHVPDLNVTIAVNCTDGSWQRVLKKTILVLKNAQEAA